jgi:hypothetical protein
MNRLTRANDRSADTATRCENLTRLVLLRIPKASLTFDVFPAVVADVDLLLTSNLAESSTPPFFCHSFSWALLRANSCVLQLRVFCFPGCALNSMGPSHKAAARFGSRSHSLLGAPRKWGKKKKL